MDAASSRIVGSESPGSRLPVWTASLMERARSLAVLPLNLRITTRYILYCYKMIVQKPVPSPGNGGRPLTVRHALKDNRAAVIGPLVEYTRRLDLRRSEDQRLSAADARLAYA